jgi:hypothetical protein
VNSSGEASPRRTTMSCMVQRIDAYIAKYNGSIDDVPQSGRVIAAVTPIPAAPVVRCMFPHQATSANHAT